MVSPINQKAPALFSCTFSENLPELFFDLNCSLVVSTYQAGKIVLISSEKGRLVQLLRSFEKPMGVALEGSKMGVATRDEVIVLGNFPELSEDYPNKPRVYDSFFVPYQTYFTGNLSTHDLAWGKEGLVGVNTSFSCLSTFGQGYHFTPIWKPFFITEYAFQDRCHLNGLAMDGKEPVYVTALGQSDTPGGWRPNRLDGGILMDVKTQSFVLQKLPMPHSPRIYDGKLYLLLSALGQLVEVDVQKGSYEVICELPGFARGLARCGDYVFIGLSRLRVGRLFGDLPLAKKDLKAGVGVVHLKTGKIAGLIQYDQTCEEIYDVQILPETKRPNILNTIDPIFKRALAIPQKVFWGEVAENKEDK